MSDYNNFSDENKKIFDYQDKKTYEEEYQELFIKQDEFEKVSSVSKPLITQQPRYDNEGKLIGYDSVVSKKVVGVDGWKRVMLLDMLNIIEKLGNKKIQVLNYIIENIDNNNVLLKNQRQIVLETKTSLETVNQVFKTLKDFEILKKNPQGIGYVLNPIVFSPYGSNEKQNRLIIDYEYQDYKPTKKHNNKKYAGQSLKEKMTKINKIGGVK